MKFKDGIIEAFKNLGEDDQLDESTVNNIETNFVTQLS